MDGRIIEDVKESNRYTEIVSVANTKPQGSATDLYETRHSPYEHLQTLYIPVKRDNVRDRAFHTIPAVHISQAQYSEMGTTDIPVSIPTCMPSVEMGPEMSVAVDTFVKNIVAANEQKLLEHAQNLELEANIGSMIHPQPDTNPILLREKLHVQGLPLIVPEIKQRESQNVTTVVSESQFVDLPFHNVLTPHVEHMQAPISTSSDKELLNLHICEKTDDNSVDQNYAKAPLKPYKCGECSIDFDTICVLHDHLQTHIDGGSYHYDHFFKTAFPKCDTFCQYVQTDNIDFDRNNETDMVLCDNVSVNKSIVSPDSRKSKRKLGNPRKCITKIPLEQKTKTQVKPKAKTEESKTKDRNRYMLPHEVRETRQCVRESRKTKLKVSQTCHKRSKLNTVEVAQKQSDAAQINKSKETKQTKQTRKGKVMKTKATDSKSKVQVHKLFVKDNKTKHIESKLNTEDVKSKGIIKPHDIDTCLISKSEHTETDYNLISGEMDVENESGNAYDDNVETHFDSDTDDNEMTDTKDLINESISLLDNENKENASAVAENIKSLHVDASKSEIKMESHMVEKLGISKPFKKRGQPRKSEDVQDVESATVKQNKKPRNPVKVESNVESGLGVGTGLEHNGLSTCKEDKREKKEHSEPLPRFKVCETCGESMARYKYINHLRQHTGEKPFVCEKCGKTFARSRFLTKHLITHEDVKPWKCHLCPAGFCQKNEFKMHMAGHTGYRPHTCNVCDASFLSKTTLQTHVANIHMGETRFECHVCHRRFFKNSSLKIHVATHFEATFKCSFCDKMFKDRSGLKRHERIHTGVKMFKCHICNHAFIQSTPFWAHMEKRHNLGRAEVKAYRREMNLMTHAGDTVFRPSREDSLPAYKVQPADIKMAVTEAVSSRHQLHIPMVLTPEFKLAHEIANSEPLIQYARTDIADATRDLSATSISGHTVTDTKQQQYEDSDQTKLLHRAIAHQIHHLVDAANPSSQHMLAYASGKSYEYTLDHTPVTTPVPETNIVRQLLPPISEAVSSHHQLHIPMVPISDSVMPPRHEYAPPLYQVTSTMPEPGSSSPAALNIADSKQLHYADVENSSLHSLYHNPLMFVANLASAYPSDVSAHNDSSSLQHGITYSKI